MSFPFTELLPELQTLVLLASPPCTRTCLALTCKRFWNHEARPFISYEDFIRSICEDGSPSLAVEFSLLIPSSSVEVSYRTLSKDDLAAASHKGHTTFIAQIIKIFRDCFQDIPIEWQNAQLRHSLSDSIEIAASLRNDPLLSLLREELSPSDYDFNRERVGFLRTCRVDEFLVMRPSYPEPILAVLNNACCHQNVPFIEALEQIAMKEGTPITFNKDHLFLSTMNLKHPDVVRLPPVHFTSRNQCPFIDLTCPTC